VKNYRKRCVCVYRQEVHCEIRPRPAHNGDGLYDLTKHRDSPSAHRSGPSGLLQHSASKAPTQARSNQSAEMNFSLYGYNPMYNPMYISHEKLNHALSSPAKDESSRAARQADDAPCKPTSVIVEHRTPRAAGHHHHHHQPAAITVDPYRCRGSITHGTAAGVKPMSAAMPLRQSAVPAAPPLTTRDDVSWSKKPTCVVNGLCWTGSQTVPSVGRPLSPPNKVDLISQGLVPNPLYSSAVGGSHRGVTEVLPKLAVAGVDYAVDMSAKRTTATRCEGHAKRPRCDELAPPQSAAGHGQGAAPPPPGTSYIDSFKSFVDHAVQSAFMQSDDVDAAVRGAPLTSDQTPRAVTVGSILRTLDASLPAVSDARLGVAGTEPAPRDAAARYEKLSTMTCVASLSSQMPSLVASVGLTSTSPAAVNNGPPLLVPQCPLESVDDPVTVASPALSTAACSDRTATGRGLDTDSDTLSAHSPAPPLIAADSPPPPTNAASSSLHLKKTWLLRYSDEDRKNTTTGCDSPASSRPSDTYEKSQDTVGTDEKQSSTDVWSAKRKQNDDNDDDDDSVSAAETKPVKTGLEKQRQDADKKMSSTKDVVGGNCREAEDCKLADGKESIKNCFINCAYLSDKDQDARALRRVAKDSGLEDKDAQSSTSKESDDSQVLIAPNLIQSNLKTICFSAIKLPRV